MSAYSPGRLFAGRLFAGRLWGKRPVHPQPQRYGGMRQAAPRLHRDRDDDALIFLLRR